MGRTAYASPDLVSEAAEFATDAGRLGLARLLDGPDPPTAVFVAGETLVLGAIQEAKSRGIAVPGDLAIAGYVDFPTAGVVDPPLTMVAAPTRRAGIQAMRTLAGLIEGKDPRPRRTVFDVELVLRDSCGAH